MQGGKVINATFFSQKYKLVFVVINSRLIKKFALITEIHNALIKIKTN